MKPLNERQRAVLEMLAAKNGVSIGQIGARLVRLKMIKPCRNPGGNNNFATSSILRSLKGLVTYFPSDRNSQWSISLWCLTSAGKVAAAELSGQETATPTKGL